MLHAIQHSIIEHLRESVAELKDVVWMYDGIVLTGRVKPYVTVEQMQDNTTVLAKERAYYEVIYRFQIGLTANSAGERTKVQETVRKALLNPKITLYNTDGPRSTDAGFFYCDVTAVTPMPVDATADDTSKHRVYFDVEIPMEFRND
jgi:hypothetical protein